MLYYTISNRLGPYPYLTILLLPLPLPLLFPFPGTPDSSRSVVLLPAASRQPFAADRSVWHVVSRSDFNRARWLERLFAFCVLKTDCSFERHLASCCCCCGSSHEITRNTITIQDGVLIIIHLSTPCTRAVPHFIVLTSAEVFFWEPSYKEI